MAQEPLDPNCPDVRQNAGWSEEIGRQKAKLLFTVIKWGGGAALVAFVAWFAWSSFTSSVSSAANAVTPCFLSEAKNCKTDDWVRSKWPLGGDDSDDSQTVTETVIPAAAASEASAEDAAVVAEDNSLCPDGSKNRWVWGDCAWKSWRNGD